MPFCPSSILIAALIAVESSGNNYAIKHDRYGRSHFGCLQIEERVVEDVNRYNGNLSRKKGVKLPRYRHRDCLKREPSIEIFKTYCSIYLGDGATDRQAAMLLRFGPVGMNRAGKGQDGALYWANVEVMMDVLSEKVPANATD